MNRGEVNAVDWLIITQNIMELQTLIEKINAMPPNLQNEVNDFADFLLEKHGIDSNNAPLLGHKEIVKHRMQEYEDNKENRIPARNVSKAIKEQYGWK